MRALAALLLLVALADAGDGYYVARLRERGVEPDAAGVGEYLLSLRPSERAQRIARSVSAW